MDLYKELKQEKQAIREFLNAYWNFSVSKKSKIKTRHYEGSPLCKELEDFFSPIEETVIIAHSHKMHKDSADIVINASLIQGINRGVFFGYDRMEEAVLMANIDANHINQSGLLEKKLDLVEEKEKPNFNEFKENFEDDTEALNRFLRGYFNIFAQPKGYREFKRNDGKTEGTQPEKVIFNGSKLDTFLGSTTFEEYLSKERVLYGDINQSRTPFDALIGAVLRQGMTLGIEYVKQNYGNYSELKRKIEEIKSDPEKHKQLYPPWTDKDKKALRAKIGKQLKEALDHLNKSTKKNSRGK